MQHTIQPVQALERINSLDFLRGVAVLGILIINIESFAYPDPWSPYKYGFSSEADVYTRFWVYFLAQGKSFGMFTLLFGAGFYIFLERLEQKGIGLRALDIYARRLLWLFIFGVIHSYLIWDGDILYHYATCGFLLFPFRSFSIPRLFLVLLALAGILLVNAYEQVTYTENRYHDFQTAQSKHIEERTSTDQESIRKWEDMTSPKNADTTAIETPRKTYWQSISSNAKHTRVHRGGIAFQGIIFRTLMMMIIGIILYKSGIFQDYHSLKYYWPITLAILGAALSINYFRYHHWTFSYYQPVMSVWKNWLFTFPKETLAVAYILLFNGLYQKFLSKTKFRLLSYAGKMALTNYIAQSILCGFIFYGYGLGLHNEFSRTNLLPIVGMIWIFQLILSWWIMRKYSQGPLEWIWRKLTYRSFK